MHVVVGPYAGLCRCEPSISRGARGYSRIWCIWRKGRPVLIPSQHSGGTRRSGLAASMAASVRLNIRTGMWIRCMFLAMPRSQHQPIRQSIAIWFCVYRLRWSATIEMPDRFLDRHVRVVEVSRTPLRHLPLHPGCCFPVIPMNGSSRLANAWPCASSDGRNSAFSAIDACNAQAKPR